MRGFIYFVACEPLQAVKIGFTKSHPHVRLRALQTGCPSRLKLLAFVEGSVDEEQQLHQAFRPLHIHGEWFRHEMKLRDFIFYLDAPSGEPARRPAFESAVADVLPANSTFCPESADYETAYIGSARGCSLRSTG